MIAFWGIVLEYSRKKFSKQSSNFFIKKICSILLRFVLNCQEYVIFKVFQVHLQLKNSGHRSFYNIFEGPDVNETISYFGHL